MTVRENTILKEEIGQLRKNLEMFTLMKKENVLLGQKIVIENVLKTNLFFEISKYLETSDILNLQQMNKSIFFGISLNSKLISTVTRNLNKKYKKKLNKLESKLCNLL